MIKSIKIVEGYNPKIYFHLKDDIVEDDVKDMVFFILNSLNGKVDVKNSYIFLYYEFENGDLKEIDSVVKEIVKEMKNLIEEENKDILTSWNPKFEIRLKEIDMELKRAYYEILLKWEIANEYV